MVILDKEKETDQVLIFLHLPKSGGNTFYDIISSQKRYQSTCDMRNCNVYDLTPEETKRLEMVYGHMAFGIHKQLPQSNFAYITFLRHPIDRVVSHYYFHRGIKDPNNVLGEMFNCMTLYDYVTSAEWDDNPVYVAASTVNIQTRLLTDTMEDNCEAAKNNLIKYFTVVGTTERFDDTLSVLEKKLGWEIETYEKRNVTVDRPALAEVPKEIIEIIKRKNEHDIALYQLANQLLDEQLRTTKNQRMTLKKLLQKKSILDPKDK